MFWNTVWAIMFGIGLYFIGRWIFMRSEAGEFELDESDDNDIGNSIRSAVAGALAVAAIFGIALFLAGKVALVVFSLLALVLGSLARIKGLYALVSMLSALSTIVFMASIIAIARNTPSGVTFTFWPLIFVVVPIILVIAGKSMRR